MAGQPGFTGTLRRLGIAGYCAMLAYLATARTTDAVAAQFRLCRTSTQHALRWMLRLQLVHRPAWYRPAPHSCMAPLWQGGPGVDQPRPDRAECGPPRRRCPSSLLMLGTVRELTLEHPLTLTELAAELRMHVATAQRLVRLLRRHGLTHVAEYDKPPMGTSVARHAWGPGTDARRPRKPTKAEHARRAKQRKRALLQHPWSVMQQQLRIASTFTSTATSQPGPRKRAAQHQGEPQAC